MAVAPGLLPATGLCETEHPRAVDVAADCEYAVSAMAELAERAKAAGRLRPDFVIDDVVLMLMARNGIHATSPAANAKASRRFATLAIQAFQAAKSAETA